MTEVRNYADARGIKPATVLQAAAGLSGTTWGKWEDGSQTCEMRTAERIRAFMASNPPKVGNDQKPEEDAA